MSSATKAELAGLYIMAHEAVYIRIILDELGHKQPPTPIQTDNAMADAVINGKILPKQTKAMDFALKQEVLNLLLPYGFSIQII